MPLLKVVGKFEERRTLLKSWDRLTDVLVASIVLLICPGTRERVLMFGPDDLRDWSFV